MIHQVPDVVPWIDYPFALSARIAKTTKEATADPTVAAKSGGMPWWLIFKLTMVAPQRKQTRSSRRLALRGMLSGGSRLRRLSFTLARSVAHDQGEQLLRQGCRGVDEGHIDRLGAS